MDIYGALAHPIRREIVAVLASGDKGVRELADPLPVSRPAVSQHLKVLKDAGLVGDRSEGARRVYYIDPEGLGELRRWLDEFWTDALESFRNEVAAMSAAQGRKKREPHD